ncbi:MAG TPA: hypothetical protein VF170_01120 [Planctomycetaceae bacterium]
MTFTCPMCGRTFDWVDDFGPRGPVVCPSCGTTVDGLAATFAASDRAAAERKVQAPAVALMVVGGLTILGGLGNLGIAALVLVAEPAPGAPPEDAVMAAVMYTVAAVFSFATGAVVTAGGWKMYRLESWGLALAASILSVIPCMVCCLFGLPIGIWSLVTLNDPLVKEAFR